MVNTYQYVVLRPWNACRAWPSLTLVLPPTTPLLPFSPFCAIARIPLNPAALAFVPFGIVLVRVRVRARACSLGDHLEVRVAGKFCDKPLGLERPKIIHTLCLAPLPDPFAADRVGFSKVLAEGTSEPEPAQSVIGKWQAEAERMAMANVDGGADTQK